MYMHLHIYIYVCVCVCVYICTPLHQVSDGPESIVAHKAVIKAARGDVRLVDAGWDTMGQVSSITKVDGCVAKVDNL